MQRNADRGQKNIRARPVEVGIADHFFAPVEVAALSSVPAEERQFRFFEYRTFKESYIKARGMGLSIPLDNFSFYFHGDRDVRSAIDATLADDPDRWQFRSGADYLVAVCAERIPAQPARLFVRTLVPWARAESFSPALTRSSATAIPADVSGH